jgi:exopolysaccharide biosynthesis predicted pyruvyltransferase EpsI
VLVRDMVSAQRAADELPGVRTSFCHDMALGWDAPQQSSSRVRPPRVLVIARQDRESSSGLASLEIDSVPGAVLDITDWGDLGAHRPAWERARRDARLQYRLARAARRLAPFQSPRFQPWIQGTFAKINTLNVTAGVALYDSASGAIVDRLHAHIIAALCGVPHVLLDNNYGKVKAVYDASTHGFSTAHYVTTLDAASEVATELVMPATT